jgi:hypothetical protein
VAGPRPRVPDYYSQSVLLRPRWPQFRKCSARGHKAWAGSLQPSPGSLECTVQVIYRGPHAPHVYVLEPKLEDGPHRYPGNRLCLFDPAEPGRRWEADSKIGETIIPWTAAWLHYYELYLETGVWRGPQAPHGSKLAEKRGD